MAIAKLFLILVSVFVQQYVGTSPNVRPPTEQLREQSRLEHAIPHFATFGKIISWTWAILEISLLLALSDYCPPSLARPIHHHLPTFITSNPTTFTALTPIFLAGTFLTLTGGLLRAYCFHVLGPRFTFELSIRPSHVLVTNGVYGVVRHPSYAGGMLLLIGWTLCLLDLRARVVHVCAAHFPIWASSVGGFPGNDGNCHAMVTSAFACLSVSLLGSSCVVVSKRMDKEDAMLEKNFGEEWRAWAKRVPYRLVPGVC